MGMPKYTFGFGAHGTVTWAELPGPKLFENVGGFEFTDVVGLRRGWGTTYQGKANTACWFHNPVTSLESIATPFTDIGAGSPVLTGFGVKFELQGTAKVDAIHVWNGEDLIQLFNNLNIGPLPSGGVDTFVRSFTPNGLALPQLGINVAVLVQFGQQPSPVIFYGALAQYEVDVFFYKPPGP